MLPSKVDTIDAYRVGELTGDPMADATQAMRQRLRDQARTARAAYDAFAVTAPLPSEGITAEQLEKVVSRLQRELDAAEEATADFERTHPIDALYGARATALERP